MKIKLPGEEKIYSLSYLLRYIHSDAVLLLEATAEHCLQPPAVKPLTPPFLGFALEAVLDWGNGTKVQPPVEPCLSLPSLSGQCLFRICPVPNQTQDEQHWTGFLTCIFLDPESGDQHSRAVP